MRKLVFLVLVAFLTVGVAVGDGAKKSGGKKKTVPKNVPPKSAAVDTGSERQKPAEPEPRKNAEGEYVFESVQPVNQPPEAGTVDPKEARDPKNEKGAEDGTDTEETKSAEAGDEEKVEKEGSASSSSRKADKTKPVPVLTLSGSDLQSGIDSGARRTAGKTGTGRFPGNGGDVPSEEFLKAVTSGEVRIPPDCDAKLRQLDRMTLAPYERNAMRMKIYAEAENILNAR